MDALLLGTACSHTSLRMRSGPKPPADHTDLDTRGLPLLSPSMPPLPRGERVLCAAIPSRTSAPPHPRSPPLNNRRRRRARGGIGGSKSWTRMRWSGRGKGALPRPNPHLQDAVTGFSWTRTSSGPGRAEGRRPPSPRRAPVEARAGAVHPARAGRKARPWLSPAGIGGTGVTYP